MHFGGFIVGGFVIGLFCQEPPVEKDRVVIKQIQEAAAVKTETPLGTISMAVSGVEAGEGIPKSSANLELGILKVADLGGLVPRKIEITPYVYNRVEANETQNVDLQKDQGVGLKVSFGNADRDWALVFKGSISAESLSEPPSNQPREVKGEFGIILERHFGGIDHDRFARLKRLENLPKPVIFYVANDDFDRKISRSKEEIQTIHRSMMTTYLSAAIETWVKENSKLENPSATLESIASNPSRLYEWMRKMMITTKPFYIEAQDRRQIYVRPGPYLAQKPSETGLLFDPNQMLNDFISGLDYTNLYRAPSN